MSEEKLEKIYIDLPNNEAVGGESMWAKPLGDDLYEIHNVPFYAYGLNYFDLVKVDSKDRTKKPIVLKVITPSGYQTFRVVFDETFNRKLQNKLFDEIKQYKAEVERATEKYVAIFIEPDGDYNGIYDKLLALEQKGVLEFETCEARNPDNFDVVD